MDKKIAGLLGAVAGLATLSSAQAAAPPAVASEPMQATSYADLLAPVANAAALLKADDAARARQSTTEPGADLQEAQAYYPYSAPYPPYAYPRQYHHHHHHHHQQYYRRSNNHHHHHQQGAFIGVPGVGGVVVNGR